MRPKGPQAIFLAGDLALDFLNTRMFVDGEIRDCLQSDADVFAWLKRAGLSVGGFSRDTARGSLLSSARLLRETVRLLVAKRKAGLGGDPSVLNRFLRHAQSHPQFVWKTPRSLSIERIRRPDTPEALLGPVAEAAAELLATADFSLVKPCEGEACVLWFYDQTRSHHRRWCSSAICGNRHKVAAYRKRRRQADA